jgi:hypothetical protein
MALYKTEVVRMKHWSWSWIVANSLGWGCACTAALLTGFRAPGSVAAGAVIGAAQWLALRRRLHFAGWWIPASALGWCVGLQLSPHSFFNVPDPYWTGGVSGVVTGVLQWLVLRRHVRRSGVWIPASIGSAVIAWVAAMITYGYFDRIKLDQFDYIAGVGAGGIVTGVLTAPVLNWLLRHPSESVLKPTG